MQKLKNLHNSNESTTLINQELSNIEVGDLFLINSNGKMYLYESKSKYYNKGFIFAIRYNISSSFKTITKRDASAIPLLVDDSNYVCNLGKKTIKYIKRQFKQDFPEFII